ncbi:sigma-70 family RNA polymerase sigma factor [Bordetella petrii]|nr:sigma-70 family RNA polymerase sigma factor [Bordetella petrii]
MSDRAPSGVLDYLTLRYAQMKQALTRRLGNADLASDVLHDTWERLQGMDTVPERERPAAYLMRVAVNIAVDKQRRDKHTATEADVEALFANLVDPAPGPARTAQARFDLEVLMRSIQRLPEQRRLVVVLVHWENLSHQEVADQLGISRRTVVNELRRAHQFLVDCFEREPE